MGILNRLREKKEKYERNKEINRFAEESRLEALEKKERSELEQERRLSERRSSITKIRQEKRKLNPGIVDKLFKPVSSRPHQRQKSYPSVYGSTKREAKSSFSTVSSPSFESGFNNVLGSSLWGRSESNQTRVKHRPIYVKKGKKYIKVKGKHHKSQNNQPRSSGFDIWGGGGIGM